MEKKIIPTTIQKKIAVAAIHGDECSERGGQKVGCGGTEASEDESETISLWTYYLV